MTLRFRSPGRINLIGEHTDYNDGYVLPAAIDRGITFEMSAKNETRTAHFSSDTLGQSFTANLDNICPGTSWENYFLGVLNQLGQKGINLPGFNCSISSDLPVGAGLSSSAALECGLAWGLNQLFQLGLSEREIIELSQAAEHTFVGTQCGIMDQFACVKGKSGHFILLDCRTLEHQYIPADLGAYQLLLLNTGVTHDLANSAYNRRRWACEEGVKVLASANKEIKSLRDATPDLVASVKNKMTDEVHKRCRYVVHENQRVLEAVDALKQKDMLKLGKLLFETHEGLKTDYEVSCPELDFLVSEARTFSGVAGARLVGGGFGGCTLNLIHSDAVPAFKERIISSYKNSFSSELQVISVALGTGVGQSL